MQKTKSKVCAVIDVFLIVLGLVFAFVDTAVMPNDVAWVAIVGLGLIVAGLCLSLWNIENKPNAHN